MKDLVSAAALAAATAVRATSGRGLFLAFLPADGAWLAAAAVFATTAEMPAR